MLSRLREWIETRAGLSALIGFGASQATKPVPRKLSWLYTAGTLAAFFFAIQFVTGTFMLMTYVPDAENAYGSVVTLEHGTHLGSLFRQMHAWGATFIVIVLCLHILKVLWYGSYKRPRELTWFVGFLLLTVTLAFCLSGYLLPWNQLGFWGTRVSVGTINSVPGIGSWIKTLVCGDADVSGRTIGRFFALHVMVLPWTLAVLVAAHLALVIKHGITPKASVTDEEVLGYERALEARGAESFFPRQVYRELLVLNLGFALLVTLAVYHPWELGERAGSVTPPGIKPEWYFLPVYQFLKYFDDDLYELLPFLKTLGKWGLTSQFIGICSINLVGLLVFILPILDRGKQRKMSRRPFFGALAFCTLLGIVGLGALGYLSERTVTISGKRYHFSAKGYPSPVPEGEEHNETAPPAPPEPQPAQGGEGAGGALAAARPEGMPPGGNCGGCHEEELAQWKGSVHEAKGVECANCHGGNPLPLPKTLAEDAEQSEKLRRQVAHEGIKKKKSGDEAARPSKSEVPAFCGKCHVGVLEVFSPAHLKTPPDGQPTKSCVTCHSNHAVKEAGDGTFEAKEAYSDAADPRTGPFLAARASFRDAESALAEAAAKSTDLAKSGFPVDTLEKDLRAARKSLAESRYLVHGLDGTQAEIAQRAADVKEAARLVAQDVDAEVGKRAARWKLVAGVWAVALVLSALVIAKLRSIPEATFVARSGPTSPGAGPPATSETPA